MAINEMTGALNTVVRLCAQNSRERAAKQKAQVQLMLQQAVTKPISADTVELSEAARAYLASSKTGMAQGAQSGIQGTAADALNALTPADAAGKSGAAASGTQQTAEEKAAQAQAEKSSLQDQLEASNEQAKAAAEELEQKLKCLKIMSNLIAGKKVPGQDQHYLAEHEPEMFAKAITLRAASECSNEKAKRVTRDEDFEIQQEAADGEEDSDSSVKAAQPAQSAAAGTETAADSGSGEG
jgi:hypothetical protein